MKSEMIKRPLGKSHDTRKIRKILNEEARLGINLNSDSEAEDVDLSKELYPLSHYINNKEEMIDQMFSIIKGDKLKKMLPPILKDMPLDELKADCLIHLLGMSKKRIHSILEGREINSSSDSETQSDSSASPSKKSKMSVKPIMIKQEGCSDISDNSEEVVLVDPDISLSDTASCQTKDIPGDSGTSKKYHNEKKKRRKLKENGKKEEYLKNLNKIEECERSHESSSSVSENGNADEAPKEKTLLEIFELEVRARAIRSLLQKDDGSELEESKTADKSSHNVIKDKPTKLSKENENKGEKITPVKHFRKKKRKSDDVIVIAPKVVTIDLTDENSPFNIKDTSIEKDQEHLKPSTSLNNQENINELSVDSNRSLDKRIKQVEETSNLKLKIVPKDFDSYQKKVCISTEPVSLSHLPEQTSEDNSEKTEQPKRSWAQRWLDSKEVKKVVSTSKICGNIRKRIKSAKLARQTQENSPKMAENSQEIQGSVDEYQLLPKSSRVSDISVVIPDNNKEEKINNQPIEDEQPSEIGLNATSYSVEQVQDVTSTKSEIYTEISIQENSVSDSKSNDIDFSSSKDECDEMQVYDVSVSKKIPSELRQIDSTNLKGGSSEIELNKKNSATLICELSSLDNQHTSQSCGSDTINKNNKADEPQINSRTDFSYVKPKEKTVEKVLRNDNTNSTVDVSNSESFDNIDSKIVQDGFKPSIKNDKELKMCGYDTESNKQLSTITSSTSGVCNAKASDISAIETDNSCYKLDELKMTVKSQSGEDNIRNIKTCSPNQVEGELLIKESSKTQDLFNNEPETLEINISDEEIDS